MPAFFKKYFLVGIFVVALSITFLSPVAAQTPTPGANAPADLTTCANNRTDWRPDAAVTAAGKSADRARQFLYWVLSPNHQPINGAPVLADLWSFSRNIVLISVVLVIVAFGFSYIFLKRRAMTFDLPPIIIKIGAVLLWASFSYIAVLGLIQFSEIIMRFFIENVGGKDLFNIIFSGVSNEKNYINFIGYRDYSFCNQESAATGLFLINLTTFTYNVMGIILILRNIILWFLLVLSPFLALLMPFVFIRNIGWIWIGVFFQWLFYGPLVSLFLAALTKIWVKGIPFAFDFSRVNKPEGQVYKTAINILYGGPAQTLTPGNSANYIDTFAEYVIALVMLWAAIFLPWLLLRIFRDYCCAAIAASANTLNAIFDRLRQYPPPEKPLPPTTGPTTTAGMAFELPFRKAISEMKKESMADMAGLSKSATREIASSLNMSISSLSDLSRLEMDQTKVSDISDTLSKIGNPASISTPAERERFSSLRSELVNRATSGDQMAQSILTASSPDKATQIMAVPTIGGPRPSSIPLSKSIGVKPIPLAGKAVTPSVSLEDYEEVKKMWLNHYRNAPVPKSEKIKNRNEWLSQDTAHLSNTINMLSSANPTQKEKGLENVATLLPFLLLGGYSSVEVITYLRAKLEAAKQVQTELEVAAKAKDEAKKAQTEEEETLVPTPEKKKEAEEKTMEEKASVSMNNEPNEKMNNQEDLNKQDLQKDEKKS